jgi:ribosomal RNA-processing protein 1
MWMCDRPLPQQSLARELANLHFQIPDDGVLTWLDGFWAIMSQQWTGIDIYRMDKFLFLVRQVFAASLQWAMSDASRTKPMLALLQRWPFDVADLGRVPVGLRLHVLDIWVDELEKSELLREVEEANAASVEFVDGLTDIVDELTQQSPTKTVRARAKESLNDERLPQNKSKKLKGTLTQLEASDLGADEDAESWDGIED